MILWAGDIKKDLEDRTGKSMRVKPELPQIAEGMNTIIQMISKLVASDAEKTILCRDMVGRMTSQQATITTLSHQFEDVSTELSIVREENKQLRRKCRILKTPPRDPV